jgi:hypothetical protein
MVKYMMVLQQWTGWHKSKKEVLQLHLLQQLVNGISTQGKILPETLPYHFNIIDTQDTLTLQLSKPFFTCT